MCGRITVRSTKQEIVDSLSFVLELPLEPRYNIAPSQDILCLKGPARESVMLRWGLIPSWAKEPTIGNKLINARAETVSSKPSFRSAFQKRRCLIVADGFYEWQSKDVSPKQPWYFTMTDQKPFVMAGLWEHWDQGDQSLETCTIITTEANALLAPLHHRMPVILSADSQDVWLADSARAPQLEQLLQPFPEDQMQAWRVSTQVNSPKNDSAELIEPLPAAPRDRLFNE